MMRKSVSLAKASGSEPSCSPQPLKVSACCGGISSRAGLPLARSFAAIPAMVAVLSRWSIAWCITPGKSTARQPGWRPRFTNCATAEPASFCRQGFQSRRCASNWAIATFKAPCSMPKSIKPPSNRICSTTNDAKEGSGNRMPKERKASAWESNDEEVRRLFLLTPDDLYFLRPVRADAQRLYRALVLLWARVERVLLSETSSIPESVIKHVSTQLGLTPAVLSHLRNPPMMRSATFEAVRTYLDVRSFQEADGEGLLAYLMEKVAQTGNYEALSDAAMDWLVSEGILRPHGETTLERLIYQARNQAEDVLFEQIAGQLSSEDRERLDHLRLGGQLNDSIIQRVQGFGTDQLSPSDEGGIIGHTTEIDAAKPA